MIGLPAQLRSRLEGQIRYRLWWEIGYKIVGKLRKVNKVSYED